MSAPDSLVCPRCARSYGLDESLCVKCGLPLVYSPQAPITTPGTNPQEEARKIKAEYAQGELVKVARAQHQAEAEMIQLMLLEEGIPTTVRRSAGFDVPDFLAAGPRDIMAPESGAAVAKSLLGQSDLTAASSNGSAGEGLKVLRAIVAAVIALALVPGIVWALVELLR